MNSRKAEVKPEIYYILGAIFLLLCVAVFIPFFMKFGKTYESKSYDDVCNNYIKVHMVGKNEVISAPLENFPCPTKKETIVGEAKTGEKLNYYIMGEVAERMAKCYNSFYRGEQNLFTGKPNQEINFCATCYHINFTKKDALIGTYEFLEFQAYHGPNRFGSEKYLDIFGDSGFSQQYRSLKREQVEELKALLKDTTAIDSSKDYLIVFRYKKIGETEASATIMEMAKAHAESQINLFNNMVMGGAGGAIAAAIVGAGIVVFTVATAGTGIIALTAIAGTIVSTVTVSVPIGVLIGAGVGAALTYNKFRQSDDGQAAWVSSIELIPFERDAMLDLNCDTMVGVQQPGITTK
jgi:hypothetical protein